MIAIVTGAAGFVGRNLCQRLINDKCKILAIDNFCTGFKENIIEDPLITYMHQDIGDEKSRKDIEMWEPDVIFHLAAIPRVPYSVEYPFLTTRQNILGMMSVLEAVRKHSPHTRIVNSSSSSIYGGADKLPTVESTPADPKSPYAMQKWQCEEWGRMFNTLYETDVVTLRYFNIFGPHSRPGGAYSTVLSAWLYHLYGDPDGTPFLEDDGEQTRDFCYVDNVVEANILAGTREKPFKGEAFNIAQGQRNSLSDCKRLLEQISGKTLDLEQRPPRKGDVRHTLADISAAKEAFGYDPTTDFENQVLQMAKWYEKEYTVR